MIGLVVATHGHLAQEMVATAEQIVGKLEAVATCMVDTGASPEDICEQIRVAVCSVDSGDGVIVLADLFGGTPCNQSLLLARHRNVEVLTGVNLPMLLKASSIRREPLLLSEMAAILTQYGQKNITCASAMLREAAARTQH